MWHYRQQQFAGNFERPLLLAEPRRDSGRAYWQSDVRRLVPSAIGQTCWVGHRNIRCPQCRQIQPSSSPGQDLGFDTYKDYEQEFLVICAKQEALFLPLDILHRFVLEWGWAGVASDGAICIICYLERRIQYGSSDSWRSSNFCISRLCWSSHHCCLPGSYGQTFDWTRNRIKFNPEAQAFHIECTGPTAGAQQDDHSGRRKIAGLSGVPGFTNHPPRWCGPGRIASIGGHRTRWEVDILNFLVRIHRSGESGLIQEVLFVLRYEPTIHGTISRFHNLLANFWLSLTYAILSGRDNHRVSLRQLQASKQDNHGVQRKFAFNRQFVRGSVGTPEGISSISGNHWIQCRAPFILDLGSWKHSKHFKKPLDSLSSAFYFGSWILEGFRLCMFVLFKSSVWIVWMLDIGHDRFSSGWILEGKYTSH